MIPLSLESWGELAALELHIRRVWERLKREGKAESKSSRRNMGRLVEVGRP